MTTEENIKKLQDKFPNSTIVFEKEDKRMKIIVDGEPLGVQWSNELQDELLKYNGINIEDEIFSAMVYEVDFHIYKKRILEQLKTIDRTVELRINKGFISKQLENDIDTIIEDGVKEIIADSYGCAAIQTQVEFYPIQVENDYPLQFAEIGYLNNIKKIPVKRFIAHGTEFPKMWFIGVYESESVLYKLSRID